MFEFDLSKLTATMTRLLLCRGSGTPPLSWVQHHNMMAKRTLGEVDDAALFGELPRPNEPGLAAVRALLYLWTGFPQEARMHAQTASPKEQCYIFALAQRQLAQADLAKEHFRQMEGHPVFKTLGEQALKMIRSETDGPLARFRAIVDLNKTWEPFAFTDLIEQARTGKLAPLAEQIAANLQAKEFEHLFCHCFEFLTGKSIAKRRVVSEEEEERREREYRRRMADRRKQAERLAEKKAATPAPKPKAEPAPPPAVPKVTVICPRCGQIMMAPESARGRATACIKCHVNFLVPKKKPTPVPVGRPGQKR